MWFQWYVSVLDRGVSAIQGLHYTVFTWAPEASRTQIILTRVRSWIQPTFHSHDAGSVLYGRERWRAFFFIIVLIQDAKLVGEPDDSAIQLLEVVCQRIQFIQASFLLLFTRSPFAG